MREKAFKKSRKVSRYEPGVNSLFAECLRQAIEEYKFLKDMLDSGEIMGGKLILDWERVKYFFESEKLERFIEFFGFEDQVEAKEIRWRLS